MKVAGILIRFLAGAGAVAALAVLAGPERIAAALPGPPDSHPPSDVRPSPNINANSDRTVRAAGGNGRGGKPTATAWQDDFNGTALDATR